MQIRVYDPKGDFMLDLDDGVEITFGYFNPAAPRDVQRQQHHWQQNEAMRTTALRIYRKVGKGKQQIAVFLGVNGYRDMSIGMKKIVQRVVVEQRINDDEGDGTYEFQTTSKRQMRAMLEPGSYDDGGEVPF